MTAQSPESLENQCAGINLNDLYLYGIVVGDVHSNYGWGIPYPFVNQPKVPEDSETTSFLRRGYIANYLLDPQGFLTLTGYHYVLAPHKPFVPVNERLNGEFWMVMKPGFKALRTYVPFRESRVVLEQSQWEFEQC